MPKLRVGMFIDFCAAYKEDVLEIDEQEWAKCETEDERNALMSKYWRDWTDTHINGWSALLEDK